MTASAALIVLAALVAAAAAVGVLQRAAAGRLRRTRGGERVEAAQLGRELGARATLVQFSTPTCARCPATARLLREVAGQHDGVVHLEVDLAERPALADRFHVLQTPTTLLVDADRRVRGRIAGPPRPDALDTELREILGDVHAR